MKVHSHEVVTRYQVTFDADETEMLIAHPEWKEVLSTKMSEHNGRRRLCGAAQLTRKQINDICDVLGVNGREFMAGVADPRDDLRKAEDERMVDALGALGTLYRAAKTWCETFYVGKPHPRFPAYPHDELLTAVNGIRLLRPELDAALCAESDVKSSIAEVTPLAEDFAKWKAVAETMRAVLREAREEMAIVASYADYPSECPTLGVLIRARAYAAMLPAIDAALAVKPEAGECICNDVPSARHLDDDGHLPQCPAKPAPCAETETAPERDELVRRLRQARAKGEALRVELDQARADRVEAVKRGDEYKDSLYALQDAVHKDAAVGIEVETRLRAELDEVNRLLAERDAAIAKSAAAPKMPPFTEADAHAFAWCCSQMRVIQLSGTPPAPGFAALALTVLEKIADAAGIHV